MRATAKDVIFLFMRNITNNERFSLEAFHMLWIISSLIFGGFCDGPVKTKLVWQHQVRYMNFMQIQAHEFSKDKILKI